MRGSIGMTLKDCVAYVTWPVCFAARARSFKRASQRSCFPTGGEIPERWQEDFDTSFGMLQEAVKVRSV